MNKYESVIIVNPNLDEAGVKALEDKFTGLINENGKVESIDKMGKRKLAYEIKKQQEGIYEIINFESNPEAIAELERIYRITDDIMKYITVKQLYEKLNAQHPGIIGINSVYDLVKRKDFPSVRIGNKFLIIEDKVDTWFEKKTLAYKK